MTSARKCLTFAWWNLHDCAHFHPDRISHSRWPKSQADYDAKIERIGDALQEMFPSGLPDLLAVCEITREAAQTLTQRLSPLYKVTVAPPYPRSDDFQVAILYRSDPHFSVEPLILSDREEDLPTGTRPMLPIHFALPGHLIRFVFCHWTSLDISRLARERLADVLRRDSFGFLEATEKPVGQSRHVVILGDLNEEPSSKIFEERLVGFRDRPSSHSRHWRDFEVRRLRLYNATWRYLGEQQPHPVPDGIHAPAGTYFGDVYGWRSIDHVLVSGGLLNATPPYFDEAWTRVVSTPALVDEYGRPQHFTPSTKRGVSDHLPIVGRLILAEKQG
jgi:endonuclease/exonuclease/phosphatase family metal-dependent hydrolase